MTLRQLPVDPDEPCSTHDEAAALEPSQDLPGQAAGHRVRLHQDECLLHRHGGEFRS